MNTTLLTFPVAGTAEDAPIVIYQIIDRKTGGRIGKNYLDRAGALRRADKLDNAYGAYRYAVVRKEL